LKISMMGVNTYSHCVPVNMRWSLLVYSKPHASFSFEIMLASASSDTDTPWIRRLDSFMV